MLKRTKRTPDTGRTRRQRRTDRTAGRTDGQNLSGAVSGAPRWVGWFTDIGRPLSAIVVMVLCAPGERHLAELAGWGPNLSWGMAGLLVMYAGIAAVVATVRPKGAPGKKTAVLGAIVSLMLAMAAQPVSHYFVTGWMTDQPRAPFWLVTVVSCVPPFVMGHLLHLAADPGTKEAPETAQNGAGEALRREWEAGALHRARAARNSARSGRADGAPTASEFNSEDMEEWEPEGEEDSLSADAMIWHPEDGDADAGQRMNSGWHAARFPTPAQVAHQMSARTVDAGQDTDEPVVVSSYPIPPQMPIRADGGRTADGQRTDVGQADSYRTDGQRPDRRTATGRTDSDRTDGQRPDGRTATGRTDSDRTEGRTDSYRTPDAGQDMATFIRDTWSLRPDMSRADMRAAVRRSFPDKKADAIRKAVTRAEEAIGS